MNEQILHCPNCNHEFRLTESLAAPLVAAVRARYEDELAAKEMEITAREKAARDQLTEAQRARAAIDQQVAAKLSTEREQIAAQEAQKARQLLGGDLEASKKALVDAEAVLKDREAKLAEAQKAQAELIRKERELEDARRELDLTVERRVQPLLQKARTQHEKELSEKEQEIAVREKAARQQLASVDNQVAQKLTAERVQIVAQETQKARQLLGGELEASQKALAHAEEVLKDREAKLANAQSAQAELLKKQRELDDAKREIELTVEKRVQTSLEGVRVKAKLDAEEGFRLSITEHEEHTAGLLRQIEDLKRRAEQGSQQLQGEAMELDLELTLKSRFPQDAIEPVAKGEFGGDVVQRIIGPGGVACGSILWESKRTKNWSDQWLPKLRDDQRRAKAEVAILISDILPNAVETFEQVEGVWVTTRRCALPVAIALRQSLIELHNVRQVQVGQQTKMEQIYTYLTGSRFRHRIEAIVEKFGDMQADLAREKKATTRLWAKREAQIQGVIEATVGMYGDMQGIVGRVMQEIPEIEVPLIDAGPTGQGDLGV